MTEKSPPLDLQQPEVPPEERANDDKASVANNESSEDANSEKLHIVGNEMDTHMNEIKEEECEIQKKQSNVESWKAKFAEVALKNKKLYNEIIELKGNIRVFCRCRPLSAAEVSSGATSAVAFDPTHDTDLHVTSDSLKKAFKFDLVFTPEATQETVFAETNPIITSVLDGYNVCIFAYGQTGSGKTFTMEGTPENRGVNYRAVEQLFRSSQNRSTYMKFAISVSMLEVYKEKIRDLLAETNSKTLEVKQTQEGSQEVPGLVEPEVTTTEEVWNLLKTGSKARSVGSTGGNEFSSRSHCLLRVTIKGENLLTGEKTKSHLWLVDLAGSERVSKTEVEGERMKESQFINKSLSALGDVISSLAAKTGHVPYRNSKLTHILQSSLGGDCKTLMFLQISPNSADVTETICSLNFATRVRGIENGPAKRHVDVSENKLTTEKLKEAEKEIAKLKETIESLKCRIAGKESVIKIIQEKRRLEQERFVEKQKPPLAPRRSPLQKITNLPPPARVTGDHGKQFRKENISIPRRASVATKSVSRGVSPAPRGFPGRSSSDNPRKALMQPRLASVAEISSWRSASLIPRRRVSVGHIPSAVDLRRRVSMSILRKEPSRIPRIPRKSNLFSQSPESVPPISATASSIRHVSPSPSQGKRPMFALKRKSLLWSPMKRLDEGKRNSLMLPKRCVKV